MGAVLRAFVLSVVCLGLMTAAAQAGTTGKLTGRVLDRQKKPVVAATVVIVGQRLGAVTDAEGKYNVLNIPAGTYSVSASRMGYARRTVQNIVVSADNTTWQDFELADEAVTMQEVVVTAQRPTVDVNLTSTKQTLTTEQIEQLPVQELQDVVNLQAGVVDGHFRGGRQEEVQYQVDGVSINNAYDNSPGLRIDRSLLQEVQVISGTFDAEYGQAMSGVVNAVLKVGSAKFRWDGEVYGGGFVFPGGESRRLTDDTVRPASTASGQLTFSGPLPFPNTVYLLSGRVSKFDDFIYGERRFEPTDRSDFANAVWRPTGDGESVPLGWSRERSGVLKISNSSLTSTRLDYQMLFNTLDTRRASFAFRYNPDGENEQENLSFSHGLDITHTLSGNTFLDLSIRQNYVRYHDWKYADVFDARYDSAGVAQGNDNYERGALIQGVDLNRFRQDTNALLIKGSLASQVNAEHLVKAGGEFQMPRVAFGVPGWLTYSTVNGVQQLVRHVDDPPDFPGVRAYHPIIAAGYLQDQIELKDLTIRAGARLDYFDARSSLPSDLANPANSITGAPESVPRATTSKASFGPRLGVAYPIEDKAAIHFAYGHFYQFPAIGDIFTNADYSKLTDLQAGGISYGVMGNPDVKPEKTVQYEFGYKHALSADIGLDFNVFYKDIRDLLGVEFIETYNGAEYARLTNVDFGNVVGFTVAFDHHRLGPARVALDYTWQMATGNSSDPRETATRASAGEDPRPRLIPFNWDQRHTLNLTVSVAGPRGLTASGVMRVGSGQPYTPSLESIFGRGLEPNSGRKPAGMVIDLRAEQALSSQGLDLSLFGRVFNALDTRYFNGAVYSSTGSPYYSRFPETDFVALRDPSRYYQPRRIEIGVKFAPRQEQGHDEGK